MRPPAGVLVAAAILSASFVLAAEQAPSLMTIQAAGAKLRPLMRDLPPPAPAEQVPESAPKSKEPGQTFDEYLSSNPNHPNRTRPAFYVQSIGDLDSNEIRLVDDIEEFLPFQWRRGWINSLEKCLRSIRSNAQFAESR